MAPLLRAAITAALLPAFVLGAAASAQAAPTAQSAVSATADAACTVTAGQLSWGFKESFRAYISGTIAKGSWTPVAPATYATPEFGWTEATGTIDAATGAGEITFPGSIVFSGHGGLLNTTIANPIVVLPGDGTATLLLDVSGVSMEDAMAGATDAVHTAPAVSFVTLDVASVPLALDETSISGAAIPTAITADGFAAFSNYEEGTAFDPITLSATFECPVAEPAPEAEPAPQPDQTAGAVEVVELTVDDQATTDQGLIGWGVTAVVLAIVAGLVAWLLSRRRKAAASASAAADAQDGKGGNSEAPRS